MKQLSKLIWDIRFTEKINQTQHLAEILEHCIGLPVREQVWPMIRQRRLLIITDDPHLATRIRFMQKVICTHMNNTLNIKLLGVDIKLISFPLARVGRKITRTPVTPQTAQTVISIAQEIQDTELRQALINVAHGFKTTATPQTSYHAPASL